jgi:hypothetical protein
MITNLQRRKLCRAKAQAIEDHSVIIVNLMVPTRDGFTQKFMYQNYIHRFGACSTFQSQDFLINFQKKKLSQFLFFF